MWNVMHNTGGAYRVECAVLKRKMTPRGTEVRCPAAGLSDSDQCVDGLDTDQAQVRITTGKRLARPSGPFSNVEHCRYPERSKESEGVLERDEMLITIAKMRLL